MIAMQSTTDSALDSRVRRADHAAGLVATKSRRAVGSDNEGGYRLIDPMQNYATMGERFDLSADDVIAYCKGDK